MKNKLFEIKTKEEDWSYKLIPNGVQLKFGSETITIKDYHEQECCEQVWADWGILSYYTEQLPTTISKFSIEAVSNMGIILVFKDDWWVEEKVLIPCYNEQNGYYSDNLQLIVNHNGKKQKIDVSEYKQDKIY